MRILNRIHSLAVCLSILLAAVPAPIGASLSEAQPDLEKTIWTPNHRSNAPTMDFAPLASTPQQLGPRSSTHTAAPAPAKLSLSITGAPPVASNVSVPQQGDAVAEVTSADSHIGKDALLETTAAEEDGAKALPEMRSSGGSALQTSSRDMYVYKYWYSGAAVPGEEMEYGIYFDNQGNATASDVVITDTLPLSTTYVSWSGYAWNPNYVDLDQTITPTVMGNQVVWDLGSVVGWGSGHIYPTVHITDTAQVGDVLTNVVEVSTSDEETDYSNNSDTDVQILRYSEPDMTISKWKNSGIVMPGNDIEYGISYCNQGLQVAHDVRITDTLPFSTSYVYASEPPGFTVVMTGNTVVWSRPGAAAEEERWLYLTVHISEEVPVGASLPNVVRVSTSDVEADYSNNEETHWETVLPTEPDLTIRKELLSGEAGAGNELTYHIRYNNRGGGGAHNVRITDTLPVSATYVADGNYSGFTTVMTGSTVVWTKPFVKGDSPGDLYLRVRVSDDFEPGDWLENVVQISTSDMEASYNNNLDRFIIKPLSMYGAAVTSVDDRTMQLLRDGGFDWVLYYLDWSETEPSKGQFDWSYLDDAVWKAWQYHLKLVVRVDRAPAWANGGGGTAPPTAPQDLYDFVNAVASRWPGRIAAYVIWNEPNLASEWGGQAPNAADYTQLLQDAYQGIKAADPDALVVSAGLATTNDNSATAIDDRLYLQQMYDAGAKDYFDALGVNPMGFASAPDSDRDADAYNFSRAVKLRDIMVTNGDTSKKMWATELGWLRDTTTDLGSYNWMKVSDIDQAHYLARAYHKARREWLWMQVMMLWNMDFAAYYSDTDHPYWFSVTGDDLSPHRAYLTLKNAATNGPPDLWLEKELVGSAALGEDLVYLIHYTNIGGQPATSVILTDTLPTSTVYVTDSIGGTPLGDDKVVWMIDTVDTGARQTITLTLHSTGMPPVAVLTNTVEASVLASEPYTDDNVAQVATLLKEGRLFLPLILKSW